MFFPKLLANPSLARQPNYAIQQERSSKTISTRCGIIIARLLEHSGKKEQQKHEPKSATSIHKLIQSRINTSYHKIL